MSKVSGYIGEVWTLECGRSECRWVKNTVYESRKYVNCEPTAKQKEWIALLDAAADVRGQADIPYGDGCTLSRWIDFYGVNYTLPIE